MPQQYVNQLTQLERRLLDEVVECYGLGCEPSDIMRLTVWGDRLVATFAVGGRKLFLKEWSAFHEIPEEIAFCLDIQEIAGAGDVPVAPVLQTQSGDRVFNSDGRRFTLYGYVGAAYSPDMANEQLASTANVLGKVHKATLGKDIGGKEWRNDPFELSTTRLMNTIKDLERSQATSHERVELRAAIGQLSELLKVAQRRCVDAGWKSLPIQPIHGDFCQFNCRFEGHEVVGVVDWDHARLGRRLVDIAHALNVGLGWASTLDHYEDFTWQNVVRLEPEQLSQWLSKYVRGGHPLSECEAQVLPWACVVLWPWNIGGFCPLSSDSYCRPDVVVDYAVYLVEKSDEFTEIAMAER